MTGKKNGLYLICSIFIFVSIHFPFIDVWIEISCLNILSLYHPGNWQWRITHSFHLGAIICEIFCLKRVLDFGTSERLWGEFQTSNFKKSKSIIYLELLIITYVYMSLSTLYNFSSWVNNPPNECWNKCFLIHVVESPYLQMISPLWFFLFQCGLTKSKAVHKE